MVAPRPARDDVIMTFRTTTALWLHLLGTLLPFGITAGTISRQWRAEHELETAKHDPTVR
jgi:hypothetical protein